MSFVILLLEASLFLQIDDLAWLKVQCDTGIIIIMVDRHQSSLFQKSFKNAMGPFPL